LSLNDKAKETHTPLTLAQALALFAVIKSLQISTLDKAYSIGYSIISGSFTQALFVKSGNATATAVSKWVKIARTYDAKGNEAYCKWYDSAKATSVEVAYLEALTYGKSSTSRKSVGEDDRYIKDLAKQSKSQLGKTIAKQERRTALAKKELARRK